MQRVIRIVVLAMMLMIAAPAVPAQACPGEGASHTRTQSGFGIKVEHCGGGGGGGGNGPDGNADHATLGQSTGGSSGPVRRTVSQERYNELFDQCRRGPYLDDLSIQCAAALPDVEEDADPATPGQPQVTVAQVREIAIARLTMGPPAVGASPCLAAAGACRGTVGVPVWLWVGDGGGSLPSDSATVTAGPYTISATAKVSKVKWSLGDGQTTVCQGVGTKYDASRHGWSSPACDFDNSWKQAGSYTLTATYVWDIAWTGDDAGSTTQSLSTTQRVTVGELQSVVSTG